jgi:hypothetical protein
VRIPGCAPSASKALSGALAPPWLAASDSDKLLPLSGSGMRESEGFSRLGEVRACAGALSISTEKSARDNPPDSSGLYTMYLHAYPLDEWDDTI